jgi:hypothetical protein
MAEPGRPADPVLDELSFGPPPSRRSHRRLGRLGAVLAALLLCAVAGWLLRQAVSPTFSNSQVRMLYDAPPEIGVAWDPPVPMSVRPAQTSGTVAQLRSANCQNSASALFNYLPAEGSDGYLAQFGSASDERWGVSSTARFRTQDAARAAFDASVANLDGCQQVTLPLQYGTVLITISGAGPRTSRLGADRVHYLISTASVSYDQISTLTGLRFGNTVSWQTRNAERGTAVTGRDADAAADALLSRMRSVARGW